ncbi:NAD(P)H-dependent oxidoreductase [Nocardia nova]|uniref:NAD(P)H-dependent oxidoreductase n=1 Tax=Nocardia nova TaxID=37330 RepID=UPI003795F070
MSGRRAMLVVSIGGREPAYSERGINGHIDDLLFPIHHGILYYPGMDVLPPFLVHGTIRVDSERFSGIAAGLGAVRDRRDRADPVPHPGRRRLRPQPAAPGRLGPRRDRIRAAPRRLRCAPGCRPNAQIRSPYAGRGVAEHTHTTPRGQGIVRTPPAL